MTSAIEKILNIPGVKVLNCQEFEGIGIIIEIQAETNSCRCPKCGTLSQSIHQNHWRIVQDLPWSGKTVLLRINRRQFRCKKCRKAFSENLNFVEKQRGYTKRLALDIVKQVLDSSIRSVAERNDLSEEEVESMLTLQASQINEIDLNLVKRIGIDEIALVKGQGNYLAIIVDLDQKRPIAILQSRRSEELRKVFEEWGCVILFQIEKVSIDLWSPYKSIVMELMPNADITADRFHVMKQVTDDLANCTLLEISSHLILPQATLLHF